MLQQAPFIHHPITDSDLATVAIIRSASAPYKGLMTTPQARDSYDQMIETTPAPKNVKSQQDVLKGIKGFWSIPDNPRQGAAILYLHGGGYVVGSARAYCNFTGQFAARTGVRLFSADYRLAPEHPFPAALDDAAAAYIGLVEAGYQNIVVVGDSAGGGLSLSLVAWVLANLDTVNGVKPAACVVMSPWNDLTLSGNKKKKKKEQELYLTPASAQELAKHYLAGGDPTNPYVSPLLGSFKGLPPIQIQVGTAEILLSDSLNYTEKAYAEQVNIITHIWEGMPHVFPTALAQLAAAENAMGLMSDFIKTHLAV